MKIYDLVNSVSFTKEDLSKHKEFDKTYDCFMMNRILSHYPDTVYVAYQLSKFKNISKRDHYLFCLKMIHKKKRYFKYAKATKEEDIKFLSDYFNVPKEKAIEYSNLLSDDVIKTIKEEIKQLTEEKVKNK